MAEVVIHVPIELKREIKKFDQFTLSLAFQKAITEMEDWAEVKRIVSKSKLTGKDALAIGREINRGIAKRHLKFVKIAK